MNAAGLCLHSQRSASWRRRVACRGRRWQPAVLLCAATVWLCLGSPASAQQSRAGEGVAEGTPGGALQVTIGIDGQYRVGRWTPVRIDAGPSSAATAQPLTLQTVDGDGVRIDYVDAAADTDTPDSAIDSPWRYVIPGSESAPLVVTQGPSESSARSGPLWNGRFPDVAVPAEKPWVLVFGDPLGIDALGSNALLGREASIATTVIDQPDQLPDHWIGYDAVDFLIVNGSALPTLAALDDARREALVQWVRGGGRLLITLGPSATAAGQALPLLGRLVPLAADEPLQTVTFEPSAIESFLSSRQPIGAFSGVVLPTGEGRPLLVGRTTSRQSTPLIMQYTVGFGRVVAVAADLDAAPFVDWPQRIELITSMLPGLSSQPPAPTEQRRRGDIAYDDMAGQLRATLDRFPATQTASFSVIALAMLGLLALIGPLDYFLVNHWLGRPLLGWLTFPLMIIACCGVLIAWSTGTPKHAAIQRLEVIDIDPLAGVGRGFSWGQIYAPAAGRFDIRFTHTGPLAGDAAVPVLTAPFGWPGTAFGGLQIAGEDDRFPPYVSRMQRSEQGLSSQLTGVPFAPASSKGVAAWWRFQPAIEPSSGLAVRRGTGLQGRLVNPLPVDLLDGLLLFGDWAYFLPTRLRAGGTIEAVETLRQKTFRWHLTNRKAITGSSQSEDWDAAMDSDLQRLTEILLFYDVAGGKEYTGLDNRSLRPLDLSSLLDGDRAMLVGRLDQPATALAVDGPVADFQQGQTVSVARVILPVQSAAAAAAAAPRDQ